MSAAAGTRDSAFRSSEMKGPSAGRVSIVIPCRNHGRYLAEAIDSTVAQTVPVRDMILVDDGSTDDTATVAARYPFVRYVRQRRAGVSAARNAGLHLAAAEHVIFLDADDRLLPDAAAVGLACLGANPDCAFSSGGVRIIDDSGAVIATPEHSCDDDHYRTLLTHNYIWTPSAVMFRASVLRRVSGFSAKRAGAEDWELYLRIAREFPVHDDPTRVADYRTGGVMSADPARMLKDCLAALRAQQPFIRGNPDYEEAQKEGIRATQRYYGDPLVEQIRQAANRSAWRQVYRGVLTLLTCYPRGIRQFVRAGAVGR
jgi:glycosyltransferase involved in cell wall biosynthesis